MSSDPRTPDSDEGDASEKGGDVETPAERERRARQHGIGFIVRCRRAGVDPHDTLDDVLEDLDDVGSDDDDDPEPKAVLPDGGVARGLVVSAPIVASVAFTYINYRWAKRRASRIQAQKDVDEGDGVETDGGSEFSARVDEMIEEIEYEIEDSTPGEAMLYARCSAAFEDAVNNTPIPEENALGVMTAALFEAAETVGYARRDVIETAREHYIDEGGDA